MSRLVASDDVIGSDPAAPARHALRDAVAVEFRKARSSRVLWSTGQLLALGVAVLAAAMVAAARSGDDEIVEDDRQVPLFRCRPWSPARFCG